MIVKDVHFSVCVSFFRAAQSLEDLQLQFVVAVRSHIGSAAPEPDPVQSNTYAPVAVWFPRGG